MRNLVPSDKLGDFFKVLSTINEIVDEPSLFDKVAEQISEEFASSGLVHNQ